MPSKATTLARFALEGAEVSTISIALISGLPKRVWVKSMLTVPSLVMSNDFIVPRLTPGSTLGS